MSYQISVVKFQEDAKGSVARVLESNDQVQPGS